MPLTPEDVSNKRFTTVRLREGYDMTEVDQFLDEVESELGRLTRQNSELRTRLAEATGEPVPDEVVVPGPATAPEPEATPAPEPVRESVTEPVTEPVTDAPAAEQATVEAAAPTADRAPAMETLTVSTTAEASAAATRLLELAGRNADQLVSEARQEAEQIVGTARTEADRLNQEARTRAEELDAETNHRRETLFGQIEQEKAELDREVENLRTFEREYRAELKSYFEEQLAALEGQGTGGVLGSRDESPVAPAGEPAPDDSGSDQQHH
jgi:DivIVA domain-containing protein